NPSGLTPDDSAPVPNTWRYTGDSKNGVGTWYPPPMTEELLRQPVGATSSSSPSPPSSSSSLL
ncbi:hypothetical protein N7455_001443, partial [Penicillium solitum]|uniref:uncharacterized protein n=1 Tax=Penicillium solitum TaxID=60172 RepID=UPI0032C4385E